MKRVYDGYSAVRAAEVTGWMAVDQVTGLATKCRNKHQAIKLCLDSQADGEHWIVYLENGVVQEYARILTI